MSISGEDKTAFRIYVWVCPLCGYWRPDESTGVHAYFKDNGPAEKHQLERASYIYEGPA